MLDWMVDLLGLPDHFKFSSKGHGGGVIHGSASEATLVSLLTARAKTMNALKSSLPDCNNNCNGTIMTNGNSLNTITDRPVSIESLVGYCSDLAHSSVERAGLLGGVTIKAIPSDSECRMRGKELRAQIIEDLHEGLVPFYVCATLGTTSVCTYDNLYEIGQICREFGIWLHVDAAYAGNSFVCPENRHIMRGIEVSTG